MIKPLSAAKHVSEIYTAREVSEAMTVLFKNMVDADDRIAAVFASVMMSVAQGKVVCLGILDGQFCFGTPDVARWHGEQS